MVKKRVIPCLDVAGGRVVKGVRFEGLRDVGDPVELAARYSELGADELVFLDVTATIEGRRPAARAGRARRRGARDPVHRRRRRSRRSRTPAACSVPARTRSPSNRAAVDDPALLTALADEFGAQAVVCAIDARGGEVVTHGGAEPRGLDAVAWAREAVERGAGEILLTSIDADGTRGGLRPRADPQRSPRPSTVPVIASGGAGEAATWRRRSRPGPRRRSSPRSSTSGRSGCRS